MNTEPETDTGEPETCSRCGSDLTDGECEPCAEALAEALAEPTRCSRCGSVLVDGDCEPCAEAQRELDAEEAPRDDDAPQDDES
jgi:recombinational DNA repair protein RecR